MELTKEQTSRGGKKSSRKGVPNKSTEELRNLFKCFLENNMEKLQSDIDKLEPKDRIDAILRVSKFILPTLRSIDMNANTNQKLTISFKD